MNKFLLIFVLLIGSSLAADDWARDKEVEVVLESWDVHAEVYTLFKDGFEMLLVDKESETFFDVRETVVTTLYVLGGDTNYLENNNVFNIEYCWALDGEEFCIDIDGEWLLNFMKIKKFKDQVDMAGKLVDEFKLEIERKQ